MLLWSVLPSFTDVKEGRSPQTTIFSCQNVKRFKEPEISIVSSLQFISSNNDSSRRTHWFEAIHREFMFAQDTTPEIG